VQQHFPTLQHTPSPVPAAPFQTVHQYLGAFGQLAIARSPRKLAALISQAQLLTAGKRALVITYKKFEKAFAAALPGVAIRHHGDIAGYDNFGDVEVVIVIGGSFSTLHDIACLASCEAGRIVAEAKPVPTPCTALHADGTGVSFNRLSYQDPAAQKVLLGIYDSSITQAIGRARGLNRTAADPVEIHVFANVPLPMPIASIGLWRQPSRLAKMMLRGLAPLGAADMRRFHPDLFPSEDAARQAKAAWGGEAETEAEARRLADRLPFATSLVTFQPAGQGHKPHRTVIARKCISEAHAAALREFGQLKTWQVETFSQGKQPTRCAQEDREQASKGSYEGTSRFSRPIGPPAPPISATVEARGPPDWSERDLTAGFFVPWL
jgi:hypothetical protein